ncbi:M91 family zinc metallopeptidase, partial [Phaeodactylibacter luteus]
AYVANNPIAFIDPDGRNIVIPLTGEKLGGDNTREYQQTVFNHLQSLTNDKLGWGKDNSGRDIVIIAERGTANSGKDLGFGTSLIAGLIQSDDKHAFLEAPASSDQGNLTLAFSPNVNLQADGTAGEGASSWIRFNPNDTEGGMNVEGATQRPSNIGLAHELFHAAINMEGINITSQTHIESEPNSNQGNTISRTEFVTRFLENFIRQEQGEPLRVLPPSNNN